MKFSDFTTQKTADVLVYFNVTEKGLLQSDILNLRAKHGTNEIVADKVTWFDILVRQFASPFIYILGVASILSFCFGEMVDGTMIAIFILINAVLGFVQEFQSERSLELLKQFVVSRARVIREGKESLINNKELVPGDVIKVETGDIIPADIRFIKCSNLSIDESGLSGESVSIPKTETPLSISATQVNDAHNIGFSSSKVVSGEGLGIVIATGRNTVMGDVAKLTVETKRDGLFEKGIASFSSFILKMIVSILVLVFVINLAIKGSSSLVELVLFSIALAVSVIPEALPVVTTLSLSRGALHLAHNHVVVKRLSAVEDLGSIDVLCTDKTGTLTENKMAVSSVYGDDKLEVARYALTAASFLGDGSREPNNSFDLAVWNFIDEKIRNEIKNIERINEIPFDPDRRKNSVLIKDQGSNRIIVRGAPEAILEASIGIDESKKKEIFEWIKEEGKQGMRVIGIATMVYGSSTEYTVNDESGLTFLGMISFIDPIKETSKEAIAAARLLGLEIKIVTGDNPEVAASVAHQVGIISDPKHVITGDELDALSAELQLDAVLKHSVFARVSPRQKYRIIELLKSVKRVGFLGEGINDAPALKVANVALVVKEASDIARDAADIVLLDPSLDVIVSGIRDGRSILQNTVKYLKITLISNFGNFFAVAIASLIAPFLPMLPIQLLLLNLLTDFPMIAIAMDNVDPEDIKNPETYNINEVILMAVVLGLVSTTFDFVYFGIFYPHGAEMLQTYWFIGSVLTELVLIYSIRTKLPFFKARPVSRTLAALTVPAAIVAIALPFTGFGQKMFHFAPPEAKYMAVVVGVALAYFVVSEVFKLFFYHWYSKSAYNERTIHIHNLSVPETSV